MLYAGTTNDGVYKSGDGGASWEATKGLGGVQVTSLAIDPMSPLTIYAGTFQTSSGVFKSTDGGENWIPVGPDFGFIMSLAVDPKTPSTIYAGGRLGGVSESSLAVALDR